MTAAREEVGAPARIVALGGGHGLYATLSAARRLTPHVTAVVTVADDGGSSGRLRSELDIVPPGDLRMALAALASSVLITMGFSTSTWQPASIASTAC